ncbi:hypothetical protein ACVWZZ_005300 [Bradyrhizobium sp. LM6.10]
MLPRAARSSIVLAGIISTQAIAMAPNAAASTNTET